MALLIILLASLTVVAPSHAQIRFDWPSTEPDIATYETPEDCLGIMSIYALRARAGTPRLDTFPSILRDTVNSLPPLISEAAKRCGDKFTASELLNNATLEFNHKENAHRLFLLADRRTEARSFADGWLASIAATDDTMRVMVLQQLALQALGARPVWFSEAIRLIEQIPMAQFWGIRMRIAGRIMGEAERVRDTAQAGEIARWLITTPGIVGEQVVQSHTWQDPRSGVGKFVYSAHQLLNKAALLDSLRSGTRAYTESLKRLRDASGLQWQVSPTMSRPIVAEYWFPSAPEGGRPRAGAVSVILTRPNEVCGVCLGAIAMVQRLKRAFPEVEFTMLARTRGYHGLVIEPPTPAQEALLIDSIWRRIHHLPATIAVHETKYWRLPEPDRRRINEGGPNEDLYPTRNIMMSPQIYLVDRAGEIVAVTSWSGGYEERLADLLNALVQQRQ